MNKNTTKRKSNLYPRTISASTKTTISSKKRVNNGGIGCFGLFDDDDYTYRYGDKCSKKSKSKTKSKSNLQSSKLLISGSSSGGQTTVVLPVPNEFSFTNASSSSKSSCTDRSTLNHTLTSSNTNNTKVITLNEIQNKITQQQKLNDRNKNKRIRNTEAGGRPTSFERMNNANNQKQKDIHSFFQKKNSLSTITNFNHEETAITGFASSSSSSFTTASAELIQQQQQQLQQEQSKTSIDSNVNQQLINHETNQMTKKQKISSSTSERMINDSLQKQQQEDKVYSKPIPSKNILSTILNRSISNNKTRTLFMDGGYHGMRNYVHNQWNVCNNIDLDISSSHIRSNNYEISTMQFDSEGILLAVGDTYGYIQLFDFDEVNAADVTSFSSFDDSYSSSETVAVGGIIQTRKKKTVSPFITFRVGNFRISCIKWHPQNENLLVVSFS